MTVERQKGYFAALARGMWSVISLLCHGQ